MDDKVICPLVDEKIDPVDCMENQAIRDEFIPQKFKQKENWREICQKCKYFDY